MCVPRAVKLARRHAVEQALGDEPEHVYLPFAMACFIGSVIGLVYAVAGICYALGHLTLWGLGW